MCIETAAKTAEAIVIKLRRAKYRVNTPMVSLYSSSKKLEAGWETNVVTWKRFQGAGTLPQPTIVLLGQKRKCSAAQCSLFFVVVLQVCKRAVVWKESRATIILYAQRRCWALLFRCWLLPLLDATRFQTSPEVLQTWGRSACANLACSTSYLQRNKACFRESTGILFFSATMQCLCQCGRLWCEDFVNAERKDVLRHKALIAAIARHLFWLFPRYFQLCWRLLIL